MLSARFELAIFRVSGERIDQLSHESACVTKLHICQEIDTYTKDMEPSVTILDSVTYFAKTAVWQCLQARDWNPIPSSLNSTVTLRIDKPWFSALID